MEKIRGVNLGNWLVLEKWMDNNLFSGTQAMDETYLCAELGYDRATERLKVHRDEFITERDFEEIAFMGFNAVRIPVPFFLFKKEESGIISRVLYVSVLWDSIFFIMIKD